jgi:AraC-like DNA-binding protein
MHRVRRTSHDQWSLIVVRTSTTLDGRSTSGETVAMEGSGPTPALAEVLRQLHVSSVFCCPSVLTEPWGLSVPAMDGCLWFHVVTSGTATVEVVPGDRRTAAAGDLVLVPHGTGHRAWGAEPAPTPSVFDLPHEHLSERYGVLRHGGGGARTDVVCGGVRFEQTAARHLLDALPTTIHLEGARVPRSDWLRATLDLMADETIIVRPGSDAVVSRLCDVLVIQAIRAWIEHDPGARTGWLGALRDDHLGAAIAAVHHDPRRRWTVGALAAEAAMSRSAFAARFTELVGEPAMQYVSRWRMHHAAELLADGGVSVNEAGRRVGYDSEAAFSRAFTRVLGAPPSTIRASARSDATLVGLGPPG